MPVAVATARVSHWNRISWPHPEWWSLGLCAAAWLLILWRAGETILNIPASHLHSGHGMSTELSGEQIAWSIQSFWWLVMVVAMMFPMVLDPIRITAARSLWRRRHRAIAVFLVGYVGIWIMFGFGASLLSAFVAQTGFRPDMVAGVAFGIALIWQITPVRRRAVTGCHRTLPISPFGWRADGDCLRYGWIIGSSCLVSCWALMLACMLSGHSVPAMIGITAIGWIERNKRRPDQRLLCAIIGVLGFTSFLGSL